MSHIIRDTDWKEGGFVIVNGQARSLLKKPKDLLSLVDSFRRTVKED